MKDGMKRPMSVTVIGWIWIGLGTLMLLGSMMALAMFLVLVRPHFESGGAESRLDKLPWFGRFFLRKVELFAAVQAGLAIFVMVSGRFFLKLRSWARTSLEAVSWLGLVYVVGFGIFFGITFIRTFASGEVQGGPPFVFIAIVVPIMLVVTVGVYAVPLGVIIWFLRGETIRGAMLSGGGRRMTGNRGGNAGREVSK